MPTGYDLLEHSHEFRVHMLKRVIAGLIDALIVFIPLIVLVHLFDLPYKEMLAGVFSGFGWFIYSVISEFYTGSSVGKRAMGFIVVSLDGPMTLSQEIVRNVPKMFWYIFLPVDILIGLSKDGDPRQRWVDSLSCTTIISRPAKSELRG